GAARTRRRPSLRGRSRHLCRHLDALARADRRLVRACLPGPTGGADRSRLVGAGPRRLLGLPPARAAVDLPAADLDSSLAPRSPFRLAGEAACVCGTWPRRPDRGMRRALVLAVALGLLAPEASSSPLAVPRVLVFTKTTGFRHESIPAAVQAVTTLGRQNGFAVDATEDGGAFTDPNLARYDAVVFLLTTGDVLDDTQQVAFQRYIHAGHGWVG